MKLLAFLFVVVLAVCAASAATIPAASTSREDVLTAYNAASDGDTITIPAGTSTWTSPIDLAKQRLTIIGAGTNATVLMPSAGHAIFRIYKANSILTNVTVRGIRFDGNSKNTTNQGLLQIGNTSGTLACDNVYQVVDFRVCYNLFSNVGTNDLGDGLTGWPAIMASGLVRGVIDHNTMLNCYGECFDLGADGTGDNPLNPVSLQRSLDYGGYDNGTIFIEDNAWFYNLPISEGDYGAENAFDGNSGSRWTIRYNSFTVSGNTRLQAVISNHENCAPRSCDGASQGDVGSLMMEIYGNKMTNNGTGLFGIGQFVHQRGGRALIYSNSIAGNDIAADTIVRLSNFRSYHRVGCDAPSPARGYDEVAHEVIAGGTTEGLEPAKTTLNGGINASVTTITLTSATGFNANGLANGFAIRIGTEMIDYTGVSGNQLTGCTRGANGTTAASHSTGASVDYLIFGVALEQINNTYIWSNTTIGGAAKNTAEIGGDFTPPDYSFYDIQSFAQRPNNWQWREGSAFSYTAYEYPHPLVTAQDGATDVPTADTRGRVRMRGGAEL